ncbi:MAG: T9SS type A sorting domain-containing protein, partial [Saprospiraceae bacterium]
NTLICVGRTGLTFELNPAGEVVWEYKTPFNGGVRQPVETGLPLINNTTFRVPRYAETYAGFAGRDLEPGDYLAFDDNALACQTVGVEEEADLAATIILAPNPTTGLVTLTAPMEWGSRPLRVTVYNALGRLVLKQRDDTSFSAEGQFRLDLSLLPGGIYMVAVEGRNVGRVVKR